MRRKHEPHPHFDQVVRSTEGRSWLSRFLTRIRLGPFRLSHISRWNRFLRKLIGKIQRLEPENQNLRRDVASYKNTIDRLRTKNETLQAEATSNAQTVEELKKQAELLRAAAKVHGSRIEQLTALNDALTYENLKYGVKGQTFLLPTDKSALREAYNVLGIPDTGTQQEIHLRYKKLAFEWHPDRNAGNAQATAKFQHLQKAYDILCKNMQNFLV